jgi:hypothetical protein
LLLRLPATIAAALSVPLPSAIIVAVTLAVGHCCLHHCQPSQLPSPSSPSAIAVGHFRELLPWRSKNCIQKQRMLTLFDFVWIVGGALIKDG